MGDAQRIGRSNPATAVELSARAAVDLATPQSKTAEGVLDRTAARRLGRIGPGVSAGRARLRPDSVGALVHAAIAIALTHDPSASGSDATAAAKEIVPRDLALVYRTSILHRVTTATAVYLGELGRDATEWALMASEVRLGNVHLDLLFVHRRTGRIQSDEIATGLLGPAAALPWVMQRVQAQIALGRATFGDRFEGARLVDLPRRRTTLIDDFDD